MDKVNFESLTSIEFGSPHKSGRMTVVPLVGDMPGPQYMTLKRALLEGVLKIVELDENATVSELVATNVSDEHILVVEGEEILGAMQNRVLNTTVLLLPNSVTRIPVSCTELGRWSETSAQFSDSDEVMPSKVRVGMKERVSYSMRQNSRDSGQSAVWNDIDLLAEDLGVHSRTSAMKDTTLRYRADLDSQSEDFDPAVGQVGSVIFVDSEMVGLEIVSSPDAFKELWPKMFRSYAIDALRTKPRGDSNVELAKVVEKLLTGIPTWIWDNFDGVGGGQELRSKSGDSVGSALALDEDLVYMSVINKAM